ncbi:hypothetical protein Pla52o_00070 [Novipirellula galeiformis]|uniref:Sulfatase n=2 Tax=Novipirellula galeiformis TaxID=2528004 RepID=A0A5C6CQD1_9BACT|nr:hypothetical protein Pla52o_00070 [Novipirellula galeiformis]
MKWVAKQTLGVSFVGGLGSQTMCSQAQAAAAVAPGKAKHIVYIMLDGAMSHLDTFDPKEGVEEAGETKPTQTRVPGLMFGDRFPKLGYLAAAIAVVRSLSTETGAHEQGRYLMRTAYKKLNSIQHPGMGAWMTSQQPKSNSGLPSNYLIGASDGHPGAGFLPPSFSPVPIADAGKGLQNTTLPKYLPPELFGRRMVLASKFDEAFQQRRNNSKVIAYNQAYQDAYQLMGSDQLKVFDIKEESKAIRDAYGNTSLGQGCLLARRLIEKGAQFIEINSGGWDMHNNLYESLDKRAADLDNAVGNLMRDLHSKGLFHQTLIVVTTEFGRTPRLNVNAGRDHHPGAFCSLLIGAGIKGGQAYGASDKHGHSVEKDHVSVADFNKTIAAAAGLPGDKEIFSPSGRPFKIGGDGTAVQALLA